jgi:hypothetical protein
MNLTTFKAVIDDFYTTTNEAPYNGSDDWRVAVRVVTEANEVESRDIIGIEFGKDWNSGKIILYLNDDIYATKQIEEAPAQDPVGVSDSNDKDRIAELEIQVKELQDVINQLKG